MESDNLIGVNEHHIVLSGAELETFCGESINQKETQYLDDYCEPMNKLDDVCVNCLNEYNNWLETNNRDPTVRCSCDLGEDGESWCAKVVSAYKARELQHPDSDQNKPVCPSCYRWIRYLDSNDVETKYEDAKAWFNPTMVEPAPKNE